MELSFTNAAEAKGRTALSMAAGYNELPSLRNFMKFPGFDLDAPDSQGRTALHFACEKGHGNAVEPSSSARRG